MEIIRMILWISYLLTVIVGIIGFEEILKNVKKHKYIIIDINDIDGVKYAIIFLLLIPIINICLLFRYLFFYKKE